MKFKTYLLNKNDVINEKVNNIPKGLLEWVANYIEARINGNVKLAKEIQQNINKEIKKLKLPKKQVYMYFGDPDEDSDAVLTKIKSFRKNN